MADPVKQLQEILWEVLALVPESVSHQDGCDCPRCQTLFDASCAASGEPVYPETYTVEEALAAFKDLARRWPKTEMGLYYRGYRGLLPVRLREGVFPIVWEKEPGGDTSVSGIEEEFILDKESADAIPLWAAWRKTTKVEKGRPRGDSAHGETEEEHGE